MTVKRLGLIKKKINMTELYKRIADIDNIIDAWDEIKTGRAESDNFLKFSADWPSLIFDIHNHLIYHTWRPHPENNVEFWIREPKLRHITAPPLNDRLVHHAIIRQILPRFEAYFSDKSYACRVGRGTIKAAEKLQKELISALAKWDKDFYVIELDIKSYFKTINHSVAKELIKRIIPEKDVQNLLFMIIDSIPEGLPIGFLPSQHIANLVGTIIDYFLSDIIGITHVRYMDDVRALVKTKEEAKNTLIALDMLVTHKMHQAISQNKSLYQSFKGSIRFCGYNVHPHYLSLISKSKQRSKRVVKRKIKDYNNGLISAKQLHDTASSISARFDNVVDDIPTCIVDAFKIANIKSNRSIKYL